MTGSFAELLHDHLRELHDAEVQFGKLLPRLIAKATHTSLREFLTNAEQQTYHNLGTLTRVCSLRGICLDGVPCEAHRGPTREFRRHASDAASLDSAIIANAQRFARYEIDGFSTASSFARSINAGQAASLLASLADTAGAREHELNQIARGNRRELPDHATTGFYQEPRAYPLTLSRTA